MPQPQPVANFDLTASAYRQHLELTHRTDVQRSDGSPVAYAFLDEHRGRVNATIDAVRSELSEYVSAVKRAETDGRFSAEGRVRISQERARLSAANIRRSTGDLVKNYTALRDSAKARIVNWMQDQAGTMTEVATRDIARPFLTAVETDPTWLPAHKTDLTNVEWAAIVRHSGRYVSFSDGMSKARTGDIREHVPQGARFAEADRRAALAGRDDPAVWRRYDAAAGILATIANSALAALKSQAGPQMQTDNPFTPLEVAA